VDILQQCLRLLGGKFVRNRPARRAADEAEAILPVEAVYLVDDAVDVEGQGGAPGRNIAVIGEQLVEAAAGLYMRIEREAPACELLAHLRKRCAERLRGFAPAVTEEAQRTFRGHRRIELPQPARRGDARVDRHADRSRRQALRLTLLRQLLLDRKSTRLNSSHVKISYAVSCLKK